MISYKKYLFIDRDGTLIEEPSDFQIDSIEKFKLMPDVIPSLLRLQKAGYLLVMISNQDGLGTESYPASKFEMIQTLLMSILESQGIQFESILICPHFEKDRCSCRKPQIGLVREYLFASKLEGGLDRLLDRRKSAVIGDRVTDLALAENMGIPGIQISASQGWKQITQMLISLPRVGSCTRKTNETQIQASVCLDSTSSTSPPTISTGIGFFDHMLEQLSYHGSLNASIQVQGDLHIDDHHTVEDTGITLGIALRQALGDKRGIERFGFSLPMDDAIAHVALDLSGRSAFVFEGELSRDSIGDLSTEMIPHFFRSFAESLGANLHIKLEGQNTHHQIESAFKAVGRSLRTAIQQSAGGQLPSTKGAL